MSLFRHGGHGPESSPSSSPNTSTYGTPNAGQQPLMNAGQERERLLTIVDDPLYIDPNFTPVDEFEAKMAGPAARRVVEEQRPPEAHQ